MTTPTHSAVVPDDGLGLGVGEGECEGEAADVAGRGDGEVDRRARSGLVRSRWADAFGRAAGTPLGETAGTLATGVESPVRCGALLRSRSWRCACVRAAGAGSELVRTGGDTGWPGRTEMTTPAAAAVAVATPVKTAARTGIAAAYHPAAAASTGMIAAVCGASQPLRRAALTAATAACRACAAVRVSATRTARPPAAVRVS
jgi:hypothetical protein